MIIIEPYRKNKLYFRSDHLVFKCCYHVIFCPKYRKNILVNEELIGIQGIVTSTDVEGIIKVKFPVAICNCYCWDYLEEELKLVKKG